MYVFVTNQRSIHQFAYRAKQGVGDTDFTLLHKKYAHLETIQRLTLEFSFWICHPQLI